MLGTDVLAAMLGIGLPILDQRLGHEPSLPLTLRRQRPGDREHALELLRAALATADKLGLKTLTDRALQLTRKNGSG